MRRLQYILLPLCMVILCTACLRDDADLVDPMSTKSEVVSYGESLTFSIAADLSSGMSFGSNLPEGAVTIIASSDYSPMETIEAEHVIVGGISTFILDEPLTIGRHSMHWINYSTTNGVSDAFMLGMRLDVEESENSTPITFTKSTRSSGSGTIDDPIEVSSPVTLQLINDNISNDSSFNTSGLYYKQMCDLNFFPYSITYSGFEGVCPLSNKPFRGVYDGGGFNIKYLTVSRFTEENIDLAGDATTPAAGLFCHISGAIIKNVNIEQPYIVGYNWVGALVGAVVCETSLDMSYSTIYNCHLVKSSNSNINSMIYGMTYVGGLVGGVDYASGVMLKDCSNSLTDDSGTKILTRYNGTCLGGVVGGTFSTGEVVMYNCTNSLSLDSPTHNSMGGLLGSGYKVSMCECENSGDISSSVSSMAIGGLVGGACSFYGAALKNTGEKVYGTTNLGGIIGTTLIYSNRDEDGSEGDTSYGNASITSAINYADISCSYSSEYPTAWIGGILGAGQISITDAYNSGDVAAIVSESYAGGIVGYTPGGIFVNANNNGYIRGSNAAGVAAYAYYYNIIGCNNTGTIYSTLSSISTYEDFCCAAGILAFGGTNGVINMCNNYGTVSGGYYSSSYYSDSGEYDKCYVGGILGRAGESVKDDRNLTNTIISAASTLVLGGLDVLCILGEGSQNKKTKKKGKIGGYIVYGVDVIRTVKKISEGFVECFEIAEEGDEFVESIEEMEGQMVYKCSIYKDDINSYVYSNVKAKSYLGKVSLKSGFDPMVMAWTNTKDFCTYVANEDTSSELTDAINEELVEIAENEAEADLLLEGFKVAFEAAIGIASLAFGAAFMAEKIVSTAFKIVKVGVTAVCEECVDWTTAYLENENNCIVVSQCSNFGHITGNGIAGHIGDQLKVIHNLSAGTVSGYTLVHDKHNNTEIEYGLVVGTPDHKAHHSYDGDTSIIDDWHTDIKDSNDDGWYEGYDDSAVYSNSTNYNYFDDSYWKFTSSFSFAMIYKNRYMSSFSPSI